MALKEDSDGKEKSVDLGRYNRSLEKLVVVDSNLGLSIGSKIP